MARTVFMTVSMTVTKTVTMTMTVIKTVTVTLPVIIYLTFFSSSISPFYRGVNGIAYSNIGEFLVNFPI